MYVLLGSLINKERLRKKGMVWKIKRSNAFDECSDRPTKYGAMVGSCDLQPQSEESLSPGTSCVSITLSASGSIISERDDRNSASVLLIGKHILKRSSLKKNWEKKLDPWFQSAEIEAWSIVNQSFGRFPKEIFIITGVILASEFVCCHLENGANCIIIYAPDQMASTVSATLFQNGVRIRDANGDVDFVQGSDERSPLFPILLEVISAKPQKKIGRKLDRDLFK